MTSSAKSSTKRSAQSSSGSRVSEWMRGVLFCRGRWVPPRRSWRPRLPREVRQEAASVRAAGLVGPEPADFGQDLFFDGSAGLGVEDVAQEAVEVLGGDLAEGCRAVVVQPGHKGRQPAQRVIAALQERYCPRRGEVTWVRMVDQLPEVVLDLFRNGSGWR